MGGRSNSGLQPSQPHILVGEVFGIRQYSRWEKQQGDGVCYTIHRIV